MQLLTNGTLLQGGKYKIEEKIGQGGFGITYRACQPLMLGRKVCIKEFCLKQHFSREVTSSAITYPNDTARRDAEIYQQKFIKEAQTLYSMHHPNIMEIYDIFEENNTAYYVMEYIEGESLKDLLERRGCIPETEAIGYIRKVAEALKYIHSRTINHFDVKPGNILVRSSDKEVILIDFGTAKHYDSKTGSATTMTSGLLSPGYAPIEQYKQGGVSTFTPETDIYALGATLYKLLTGKTPPEPTEIICNGIPELPSSVSTATKKLIKWAMQLNKADRPHSCDEFLNALPANMGSNSDSEDSNRNDENDDSTINIINEETCILQPTGDIKEELSSKQRETTSSKNKPFADFLLKYANVVMIIAGLVFIYDIVSLCIGNAPHEANVHANFAYIILHNIIVLFMMLVLGIRLPLYNRWYWSLTSLGILLWISQCIVDWNANYVWSMDHGRTILANSVFETSQLITVASKYGCVFPILSFVLGFAVTKKIIDKVIFGLLIIYVGVQTLLNNSCLGSQCNQPVEITIAVLLIAAVLYLLKERLTNMANSLRRWILCGAVVIAIIVSVFPLSKDCNDILYNKEEYRVNGVSFKMVYVKGGTFMMDEYQEEKLGFEINPHQVTIAADYYIGETEVTQELWQAVMGTSIYQQADEYVNEGYGFRVGDKQPMFCVSYNECEEFVKKLNMLTGEKFYLPTQAEWEYAAKGGSSSKGYKYSGSNIINKVAWNSYNSGKNCNKLHQENCVTHEVATLKPNELGIYDMSGNVSEWCSDHFEKDKSTMYVRGGDNTNLTAECLTSFGHYGYERNRRSEHIGIRLALTK